MFFKKTEHKNTLKTFEWTASLKIQKETFICVINVFY